MLTRQTKLMSIMDILPVWHLFVDIVSSMTVDSLSCLNLNNRAEVGQKSGTNFSKCFYDPLMLNWL